MVRPVVVEPWQFFFAGCWKTDAGKHGKLLLSACLWLILLDFRVSLPVHVAPQTGY